MYITSIRLFLILLVLFLFNGCTTNQSISTSDGYNTTLPIANSRAIVWGNHQTTVTATTAWLQKVGLTVIDQKISQQGFDESQRLLSDLTNEKPEVLQAATHTGADYLVIVDTIMTPSMVLKRIDQKPLKDGKGTVTVQKLSVSVRGMNVKTNEVDWSGLASYPEAISGIDQKLRALTWDALGMAWGVQSPYTSGELRSLKQYQLMNPAIDIDTFPQIIQ